MNPAIIIIIAIFVIGTIIFLAYHYSSKQVIIRTLSKIPLKPASGLRTNELSKVSGKALHVKEPLLAPYSQRKCVFYQIKIEQKVNSGKSSHWRTLIEEERSQEFFVETNSDFVIVKPIDEPKNYITYLVKDKKQSSGTFNSPTPEFEALLRRYNIESQTFFGFNKQLRYREGIIEIGEQVTVAGIAKWRSLSEPLPDYPYSKIAELTDEVNTKLIITDLPEVLPEGRRR